MKLTALPTNETGAQRTPRVTMVDACGLHLHRGERSGGWRLVALRHAMAKLVRGGGRPKTPVDGGAGAEKFGDEFAGLVVAKDHAIFANAQTPEPREFVNQGAHVALLPHVHVIQSPTDIPSYAWMQLVQSGNNLVGEPHYATALASW